MQGGLSAALEAWDSLGASELTTIEPGKRRSTNIRLRQAAADALRVESAVAASVKAWHMRAMEREDGAFASEEWGVRVRPPVVTPRFQMVGPPRCDEDRLADAWARRGRDPFRGGDVPAFEEATFGRDAAELREELYFGARGAEDPGGRPGVTRTGGGSPTAAAGSSACSPRRPGRSGEWRTPVERPGSPRPPCSLLGSVGWIACRRSARRCPRGGRGAPGGGCGGGRARGLGGPWGGPTTTCFWAPLRRGRRR